MARNKIQINNNNNNKKTSDSIFQLPDIVFQVLVQSKDSSGRLQLPTLSKLALATASQVSTHVSLGRVESTVPPAMPEVRTAARFDHKCTLFHTIAYFTSD